MKEIILKSGEKALVDDEDYELLNKFKWQYQLGYAVRNIKVYMHRDIIKTEEGLETDHINGNKLDNRKENLRKVTQSQNQANRKKGKNKSSIYKGVIWHKRRNHWLAQITINRKKIYLGSFNNEIDAAKAYNEAAIKYFGEFARLNEV